MSMREGPYSMHITIHGEADAAGTWTNMPAANTFLFGSSRHVMMVDLTGMSKARFKVNKQATAGAAGAKIKLVYCDYFSTNVADYRDLGAPTPIEVSVDVQNTFLATDYLDISPDALGFGEVFIAIIGSGGNGTADPQFGAIGVTIV